LFKSLTLDAQYEQGPFTLMMRTITENKRE